MSTGFHPTFFQNICWHSYGSKEAGAREGRWTELQKDCHSRYIKGITHHRYRYAWAELLIRGGIYLQKSVSTIDNLQISLETKTPNSRYDIDP
jgi:hypothetical protein